MNRNKTPFHKWNNGLDQFTFVLLIAGCLVAGWVGWQNLYTVMMSSMLPVFLESPSKAMIIALAMPSASLALKAVTSKMDNERIRDRYTSAIAALLFFTIVFWIYLFAMEYQSGMSSTIDLGDLGAMMDPSGSSAWLVGCQHALEVLAGATLWLMAEGIWAKYSPDVNRDNPEWLEKSKNLDADRAKLASVEAHINASRSECNNLKAKRAAYVNERVAKFISYARRMGMCVILGLTFGISMPEANAKDFVIVVSPAIDEDKRIDVTQTTVAFMARMLEAGERAIIMDGFTAATITTFEVPHGEAYKHTKAKVMANRYEVGSFYRFMKTPTPAGLAPGALNLPKVFRSIGRAVRLSLSDDMEVIVIGSPIFDDPAMPAFSMLDGLYPGDGMLNVKRARSPFGTIGDAGMLDGLSIYWATVGVPDDDRLRFQLERFYTLYVERLGGSMAAYAPNMEVVMENAEAGTAPIPHEFVLSETTKVEMIRLAPVALDRRSLFDRLQSTTPISQAQFRRAESVEMGARWTGDCDLDIRAQPMPGAPVLFFGNTETEHGLFFKDYRSANAAEGFETIMFSVPLDLRALRVAVNFYEGSAPPGGVEGEFRLDVDGQTYAMPFRIPANAGNQGRDAPAQGFYTQSSEHTVILDLDRLLQGAS